MVLNHNIGQLRNRVTVKRYSKISDNKGGYTNTTATLYTDWANVQPMTGQRLLEYEKITDKKPFVITMRKRSDKTISKQTDYIEYSSEKYIIHSLTDLDNRGIWIELICVK